MEKTQENLGKFETQLKQWGAKLDEFVAKADRAGTTARIDNRKRIDDLRAKCQAAQSKYREAGLSGFAQPVPTEDGERLCALVRDAGAGDERAWGELEIAFRKLGN